MRAQDESKPRRGRLTDRFPRMPIHRPDRPLVSTQLVQDLPALHLPDGDRPIPSPTGYSGSSVRLAPLTLDQHLFEPRGGACERPIDPGGIGGEGADVVDHQGGIEGVGEEVVARWGEGEGGDLRGQKGRIG